MQRSKKAKVLTSVAAVALAASMIIGGGTYAYLQGVSDDVVNTFNANQVTVDLQETTGDEYNIIPGTSQEKDPKVTVNATVDAYVFVEVTDNTDGLVDYAIEDGWIALGDAYPGVYYREVAANADVKEFNVLKDNTVSYDAALTNENMLDENGELKDGLELTFKAYAIQAEPFANAVEAWNGKDIQFVADEESLKAALEAGGEIVLTEDIEIADIQKVAEGATVTLDLNGKTITVAEDAGYLPARPIENHGTLTVTGNGTIDTSAVNCNGAIRNYGDLTIENGTFIGCDSIKGAAIDTQDGGTTVIHDGTYYGYIAVITREGGKTTINGGDFMGVSNDNPLYPNGYFAYAITSEGEMIFNGGYVHGSMNGGISCDKGIITINDVRVELEAPSTAGRQTYWLLVTNKANDSDIVVNGGTFEQKNGTDRLIGGFSGMPSWDATEDLADNGYTINGGTFILNGEEVTIGE